MSRPSPSPQRLRRRTACSVVLVGLIISAGVVQALPSQRIEPPVYIWPMVFCEDFINAETSLHALLTLQKAWSFAGARPQVFLGGLVCDRYAELGLDLHDFFARDNLALGYHGEVSTGPPPVLVEYLDPRARDCGYLTEGLRWDDAYRAVQERYAWHLDPLTGREVPGFGGSVTAPPYHTGKQITALVSRHWECAPAGPALRELFGVHPQAIEVGPLPAYFSRAGRPQGAASFRRLVDTELMWYQGVLNFVPDTTHQSSGYLNRLSLYRSHVVALPIYENRAYAVGDIWEWAYHNSAWGCYPPSLFDALTPDFFLKTERAYLRYLADYVLATLKVHSEFISRHPRSRFVNAPELLQLVEDLRETLVPIEWLDRPAEFLAEIAHWEAETVFGPGVRRPPMYLTTFAGQYLSLAETYYLLSVALAHYRVTGSLPAEILNRFHRGPKNQPYPVRASGHEPRVVPGTAILNAALDFVTGSDGWIPEEVRLGGLAVNPAEMLHLMAVQYQHLRHYGLPTGVPVRDVLPCSYGQTILEETFAPRNPYPLFLSSLQLWTLKPARFKNIDFLNHTPPRIIMAGYGHTHITEDEGGLLNMVAWPHDPDGDVLPNLLISDLLTPGNALLKDDGTGGDRKAGDGIYTLGRYVEPGVPEGEYLLNVIGLDRRGNFTGVWPYFEVRPDLEPFFMRFPPPLPPAPPAPPCWETLARRTIDGVVPADYNLAWSPRILAAGFGESSVTAVSGGIFRMEAAVVDPQGLADIADVRIWIGAFDTQVTLVDDGRQHDSRAGDGIFTVQLPVPEMHIPAGRYLLELVATDRDGHESLRWPYLTVLPARPKEEEAPASGPPAFSIASSARPGTSECPAPQ
jgi:hypothetical protein